MLFNKPLFKSNKTIIIEKILSFISNIGLNPEHKKANQENGTRSD